MAGLGLPRGGGARGPREAARSAQGEPAGGGGRGRIHGVGLAFIVPEGKRDQEKYRAFHTLVKRETSRVIKPLKGKVGISRPTSSPICIYF